METELRTKFVFESGRSLSESPEGQPLNELLSDFSKNVLEELDKDNLVIVGGESGLGKSELFLSSTKLKVQAGGIVDILNQQDRTYRVVSAQSMSASRDLERILNEEDDSLPEVVLIDESAVMIDSKYIKFDIVKKLLDRGRKIVLVGGGNMRATEQNKVIKNGLNKYQISVNDNQIFEFPANTLNKLQSEQLLIALNPDMTEENAHQVIDGLDKQNIPRIFRVVSHCLSKVEWNTRVAMSNFISHIKIEPI